MIVAPLMTPILGAMVAIGWLMGLTSVTGVVAETDS